jgi:hypothetical protein
MGTIAAHPGLPALMKTFHMAAMTITTAITQPATTDGLMGCCGIWRLASNGVIATSIVRGMNDPLTYDQ